MKQNSFRNTCVVLMLSCYAVLSGQGIVSGVVTEADSGMPIPGANVVVKGTNQGTVTDFDGKYSIDVKTFPVVLVFSSLGFSSKEVSVNTASVLNVTLSVSATALDEVVITGLATSVKRSNSANAVASISAQKLVGVAQPQTLSLIHI